MEQVILNALNTDKVIDITTIGRKSSLPRRIEIWFHNIDDTIYISGLPGTRDWYANLVAEPEFTFHFKESLLADLPARATPITEQAPRRAIMARILGDDRRVELDEWVAGSPLIQVALD
jgi:hypothetical protein